MALALSSQACAGDHDRAPLPPLYKQECTACHAPYPRSMLPAQSWQRIMSGLSHHFGTDASIDAAQAREIGAWLVQGAADPRRGLPPDDRVTRSPRFLREHDEVPAATWKRASIKSPSNCAACHTQADQGDFSERNIRIPR